MIGTDELAFETLTGCAVDDVAIDLAVAVDNAILTGKILVLGMDVEGVGLLFRGPKFAAQVFVVRPEAQLISVLRVVTEPVVDVIV